ncbi:hypothetical protein AXF42_Ash014592 [Apostasia shenzhenica]|uniref:Saposin B-type domain-containing protein n=1 Tax=Apostasia shenzhenica TaxID=1088818 RepID=A0A2I0AK44_9ASPA|nr:hypothetical protein AXF42_Ash014592 [Apostasia shenzhenica]
MAMRCLILIALVVPLFFSCLVPFSLVSAKKKAAPASARKDDIPFIKCQVCQKVAYHIYNQVKDKESQISPKKVSEYDVIEIAENVCNLKKAEADWILQIDIVEKGDKLELVEQGVEGQCNSECKTIERACQEIMGYSDTDVAEFVFSSKPSLDSLVNFLCHDLSKACVVDAPPVPEGRIPGEAFVAKPTKDAEMEKILRSMEGMPGAPGMKMYSREDLMNNNFGDEDEDDDDEDDEFSKNLKEVLKQKNTAKEDLKEKVLQGIKETGNAIKGHANKFTKKIKSWWKGKKTASRSPKSTKMEL